jgi:hypothetical protein
MGRNGSDVFVLGEEALDVESDSDSFEEDEGLEAQSPFAVPPAVPTSLRVSRRFSGVDARRLLAVVGLGGGIVVLAGVLVLGGGGGSTAKAPSPARTQTPVVEAGVSAPPSRPVEADRQVAVAPARSLGRAPRREEARAPRHVHRHVKRREPVSKSAPVVAEPAPAPVPVPVAVPQPPSPPVAPSPPPASGGGSGGGPEFSFER